MPKWSQTKLASLLSDCRFSQKKGSQTWLDEHLKICNASTVGSYLKKIDYKAKKAEILFYSRKNHSHKSI